MTSAGVLLGVPGSADDNMRFLSFANDDLCRILDPSVTRLGTSVTGSFVADQYGFTVV